MNWRLFGGAAILAVGLLWKLGVPPLALVMGVGLAALLSWMTRRNSGNGMAGGR